MSHLFSMVVCIKETFRSKEKNSKWVVECCPVSWFRFLKVNASTEIHANLRSGVNGTIHWTVRAARPRFGTEAMSTLWSKRYGKIAVICLHPASVNQRKLGTIVSSLTPLVGCMGGRKLGYQRGAIFLSQSYISENRVIVVSNQRGRFSTRFRPVRGFSRGQLEPQLLFSRGSLLIQFRKTELRT